MKKLDKTNIEADISKVQWFHLRMWPFDFSCKFWPYSVDQNGSMAMNAHTPIHISTLYFVVKESDETVCEKKNRETKLK